jgi:hypothetical protein
MRGAAVSHQQWLRRRYEGRQDELIWIGEFARLMGAANADRVRWERQGDFPPVVMTDDSSGGRPKRYFVRAELEAWLSGYLERRRAELLQRHTEYLIKADSIADKLADTDKLRGSLTSIVE